jgi:hypothetical protein
MKLRTHAPATALLAVAAFYVACGRPPETGIPALLTQLGDSTDVLARALDDHDVAMSRASTFAQRLDAELEHEGIVRSQIRDMVDVLYAVQGCTSESELPDLAYLSELAGAIDQTSRQHVHAVAGAEDAAAVEALEDEYNVEARRLISNFEARVEVARDQITERMASRTCQPPPPRLERAPRRRPEA